MKERDYGIASPHHHQMLRAFVRGNALWPQVNMGVHVSMGYELVQKPPDSLISAVKELPYMDEVVVSAMNTQHKRHGVRQFDIEPARTIYSEFYWDALRNTQVLMGRGKVLNEQMLRGMTHLLLRDSSEREDVAQVYTYLHAAMQAPHARELSVAYRATYRDEDRYAPHQNRLRADLVREAIASFVAGWPREEFGSEPPFRYKDSPDGRPGLLVFSPAHASSGASV